MWMHTGKARETRRPAQEGQTAQGYGKRMGSALKKRNELESNAYLTLTGSCVDAGARLTSDLATPSATRPGHESGLLRTSVGSERAQTTALKAAEAPYEPMSAARIT